MKFHIRYNTNEVFTGSSLQGDWQRVSDGIVSLVYEINNQHFKLEGYTAYNHIVERVCVFGGREIITAIYIIGRMDTYSDIIAFNLRTGKLAKIRTPKDKEYNEGAVSGWKTGHINNER